MDTMLYDSPRSDGPTTVSTRAAALTALWLGALITVLTPAHARAEGANLCKAASATAVGQALHLDVVRAEAPVSDAGCEYSVKVTPANATGDHAIAMIGSMGGAQLDPQTAKAISSFSGTVLGEASAKQEKQERHPGEIPALVFLVSTGNAQEAMKINRDMLGRMSRLTTVPGLGDDAFETSDSVLMVRKGDRFIHFIYSQCHCASSDVIPLAKRIVAGL